MNTQKRRSQPQNSTAPTDEPAWLVRLRRIRLHPDETAGLALLSRDAQLLHLVGREYCTSRNSGFISDSAVDTVLWPRVEYLLALPIDRQPGALSDSN